MAAEGLQQGQAFWRALYYFNLYRLCLGVTFVALAVGRADIGQLGERIPDLFTTASVGVVVMAILNMTTITRGDPPFRQQAHVQFSMDVILITVLSFSSGGISSGVNLLLIVSVAAGGVVLSGRMSLFFAALATILTFAEQILSEWLYGAVSGSYFQVGLLGVALFSTGLLMYFFAFRIRRAEAMVEKSAADLASLAKLNEMVVDRLDTGVVVTGPDSSIKLLNDRARKLLSFADISHETRLPADLEQALHNWRRAPEERTEQQISSRRGNFAVRVQKISGDGQGDAVIFLEDLTQTERRAQQLKLAALGRLTGAVAHEIRNPLAAISHAGQLMSESNTLAADDRRLVDIITRHSDRIDQIVSSILALGRPGSAQLTSIALKPWLHDFCQGFAESHNKAVDQLISLEAADIRVCTNPDHLAQVLTNLCENALRHGPNRDLAPQIKLEADTDGDSPHLDVINAGPAIGTDIREKMFEPFFSTDGKGLGLGLYLSRELCQNNYGRLDYIANEHSGRFRIQFAPETACAEQ